MQCFLFNLISNLSNIFKYQKLSYFQLDIQIISCHQFQCESKLIKGKVVGAKFLKNESTSGLSD